MCPSGGYMYASQVENTCVMQASLEVRVTIDVVLQILIGISLR